MISNQESRKNWSARIPARPTEEDSPANPQPNGSTPLPEWRSPRAGDILAQATAFLAARGVATPDMIARWMLSDALGRGHLELGSAPDRPVLPADIRRVESALRRLGRREPLQYVQGFTEFRGHRLATDARALIPRPETELLVGAVLDTRALWRHPHPLIVDVGTGSGCVAIALAIEGGSARLLATDVSEDALELAGENARLHGVTEKIRFRHADLLEFPIEEAPAAVVSNPPYIATADLAKLEPEIREYEPSRALDGGTDGLMIVRRLVGQSRAALREGGHCFLEIGATQRDQVEAELAHAGFVDVRTRADLAGHDRVVSGRLAPRTE